MTGGRIWAFLPYGAKWKPQPGPKEPSTGRPPLHLTPSTELPEGLAFAHRSLPGASDLRPALPAEGTVVGQASPAVCSVGIPVWGSGLNLVFVVSLLFFF